jgi:O-methyltransferase
MSASKPPSEELAYTELVYRDGSRRLRLADGRELRMPPYTFSADGLATVHDASFLSQPRFREAYAAGADSGQRICAPEQLHIEWRVYVCCWAAAHAAHLPGDFAECGVSTGITSLAVCRYVQFESLRKTFWLFDTFAGIPEAQAEAAELELARSKNRRHYFDSLALVQRNFSAYPNVRLVPGVVPDSLAVPELRQLAYLHIDMNIAYPEVQASRRLWDLLCPGAVVVYDDYGSAAHRPQKLALDAFAAEKGVQIMSLPTGQGLLLHP